MDQELRNRLRNVVTQCRTLLERDVRSSLEGTFTIYEREGRVVADADAPVEHLKGNDDLLTARRDILDHFNHIKARGFKAKDALDQLIREIAFTHLNRFCAYKMMEARGVYVGGQKFREAVSRGVNSNGVKFYLADHPEDERLFNTGHQDIAYRHFLDWLGGLLSEEIGVLFNPNDPANRLYPRQTVLDDVLDLLNNGGIKPDEPKLREEWSGIWSQDETIGWVYQYFTPKELRDQARKESAAPRNSYELAFRNQFFTPRYVVEFLTDNTLGRIWYEMRKGETKLREQCTYMVSRPTEGFLVEGEQPPHDSAEVPNAASQEDLLKLPVHIPYRRKKDPRNLKILDPASGSGHFLLYCFDLLLTIYEEAYTDPDLALALQKDYSTFEDLRRDVPRLILAHNLHGIDIDLRASQIAALALWLRCQREYQEMGVKKDRPKISRSNLVCAEPMPGEQQMLGEFIEQLEPRVLGQLVAAVFDEMQLAGEAGSLLKVGEGIRETIAAAKEQWVRETTHAIDRRGQPLLFTQAVMDRMSRKPEQASLFDLTDLTDDEFFEQAEFNVVSVLRDFAERQEGHRFQRRLFAQDAVRGFAFVDLALMRYDVVLMNPPFGAPSKRSQGYLAAVFPISKNDLFAAFIERGLHFLHPGGFLGAITSRTGCFLTLFSKWRDEVILKHSQPRAFADFGGEVLDTALVETAAYSLEKSGPAPHRKSDGIFFRLLSEEEKDSALRDSVKSVQAGTLSTRTYLSSTESFRYVPGSPFSYWASNAIRLLFKSLPPFDNEKLGRSTRCGLGTLDNFRFIRLRWEIDHQEIGDKWRVYYHGGVYSPFYDEFPCVVLWANDGADVKRYVEEKVGSASRKVQGEGSYFQEGFVFPRRTKGFAPKFMPKGGIFSNAGQAGFVPPKDLAWAVGLLATRICTFLLSLSQGRTGDAAQFEVGLVKRLPWPNPDEATRAELGSLANTAFQLTVKLTCHRETCHHFTAPPALLWPGERLEHRYLNWMKDVEETSQRLASVLNRLNEISLRLYGVSEADVTVRGGTTEGVQSAEDSELEESASADSSRIDARAISATEFGRSLVSYLVGCVFGVWNTSLATARNPAHVVISPTAPLPQCPLGHVVGGNGDYAKEQSVVMGDGMVVDDPQSPEDLVLRLREQLEFLFENQSEEREREITRMVGVKDLREYLRRTSEGGFWEDHVSRYSNSRRIAPIYWLLQSSRRSFAIWIYYQRLHKDTLFKAVVNIVEPKIRLEQEHLKALRGQVQDAGEAARGSKRGSREIGRQEDLIAELKDFEERLRRAAALHLEPDLNDGVVLNIAPLHELVPWKEAKKYWDELLAGKYEWSSIGRQLRQKGLVK